MFETSKDLFYIVLSFCILWFTVFLCWALYYMIRMLKDTSELMRDIRDRIERVSSVMNFFKSKMLEQGMKGIFALISHFRGGDKSTKNKKK